MSTSNCEVMPSKQKKSQWYIEWEGERKVVGDAFEIKSVLESLEKLGYKSFRIGIE
jgi:hypothetical protein